METVTLTHKPELSVHHEDKDGADIVRMFGEAIRGEVVLEVEPERVEVDVNGRLVIVHRTRGLVVDGKGVKVSRKRDGYAIRVNGEHGAIIVLVHPGEGKNWTVYVDFSDEMGMYRIASTRFFSKESE